MPSCNVIICVTNTGFMDRFTISSTVDAGNNDTSHLFVICLIIKYIFLPPVKSSQGNSQTAHSLITVQYTASLKGRSLHWEGGAVESIVLYECLL